MEYESLVEEETDKISQKMRRIIGEISANDKKMNDRIEYLVQGIIHDFWITQIPDKELLVEFYYSVGHGYVLSYDKNFVKKSIHFLTEASLLNEYSKNNSNIFNIYNDLGVNYHRMGNILETEKYYDLAFNELSKGSDDFKNRVRIIINQSTIHTHTGNYQVAVENLSDVLILMKDSNLSENIQNDYYGSLYYNLAINYFHLNNIEKSIKYFKLGINIKNYSIQFKDTMLQLITNMEMTDNNIELINEIKLLFT